jgi:hypothetical protein
MDETNWNAIEALAAVVGGVSGVGGLIVATIALVQARKPRRA